MRCSIRMITRTWSRTTKADAATPVRSGRPAGGHCRRTIAAGQVRGSSGAQSRVARKKISAPGCATFSHVRRSVDAESAGASNRSCRTAFCGAAVTLHACKPAWMRFPAYPCCVLVKSNWTSIRPNPLGLRRDPRWQRGVRGDVRGACKGFIRRKKLIDTTIAWG